MPTVLHIDGSFRADFGENADKVARMFVRPGDSVYEVMKRLGYQVTKIEQVPAPARELSDEAKNFLASYKRGEPGSVLAIYWRYHSLEAEEFDTVEEAERFLEGGEEYGSLASEAIVNGDQITVLD